MSAHAHELMKYAVSIILFLTFITEASFAQKIQAREDSSQTIAYLLEYVEQSEVTFIRNGREYNAKKASKHMQRKYKHYKDEIKTPEDFIRLAGTKSMMSGKSYKVRLKDGEVLSCSGWLLDALKEYRKTLSKSENSDG